MVFFIHMEKKPGILHTMDEQKKEPVTAFPMGAVMGVVIGAVLLGVLSGFIATKFTSSTAAPSSKEVGKAGDVAAGGQSAGIKDAKTFKDTAEGVLKEGGMEGEGSYHIERTPGQADQNAYLTSTAVDLSAFVGKKVKVWGQTFAGEKAGWLMDVGYVEVIK
jgi:hypothetical protein